MRILYFYQYFSTPNGSWGTRVYEFAKDWVKEGHEVTVVTSIYSKSDLNAEKLLETQYFEGIKVKVINVEINNKQSVLKRIFSFLSYSFFAIFYALTIRTDVVVASSGPITVGLPGLVAKWLRGKKLVFETRDLWPDGAIELKVITNKVVIAVAKLFEKVCYASSSLIVALSPGMKNHIIRNSRHKNVISVTNAANLELFDPVNHDLKQIDYGPGSYAIYTGNIGEVNNSYWLFNAALSLRDKSREDIRIVLVGDGQQKQELMEKAKEQKLSNLIFRDLMPKKDLVQYVLNSKVSLVPLKGLPILDTSSPNKFFESLAGGVPVIQNTQGWMKDFLEEHQVGYTADPNDPEGLADLLIDLFDQDDHKIRSRARQVAVEEFDQHKLSSKYLTAIEKLQ